MKFFNKYKWFIIIAVVAAAYYYWKIYLPKQKTIASASAIGQDFGSLNITGT